MGFLMVFTSDGRPAYYQADDLEDALRFAERLRNVEDVLDVRLYRLHEIPIEFKAYYKVELVAGDPAANGGAPSAVAAD